MGREMRTHLAASSNILGHRVPVLFHMHQSGRRDEKQIAAASTGAVGTRKEVSGCLYCIIFITLRVAS